MSRGGQAGHRFIALAATSIVALLVAGCGSTSSNTGTVSATSYVGQVCTSVATWVQAIQTRAAELERQSAARQAAASTKKELEAFVSNSIADTETAVNALRSAGVPNVSNGPKLSTALIS
ncbi:MAG: hypothetical protein ACYDA6_10115, partial [Solirubrobacteraceae bacterium]